MQLLPHPAHLLQHDGTEMIGTRTYIDRPELQSLNNDDIRAKLKAVDSYFFGLLHVVAILSEQSR
jgi:hypothetical protein